MGAPTDMEEAILDEAIAWSRVLATDDADWDAYTTWLEADPRHRQAFDQITLLDNALDRHRPELHAILIPASAPETARPNRRFVVGVAVAACLAAAIGLPLMLSPNNAVTFSTGAQARTFALNDGSQVLLSPASALTVMDNKMSSMVLEKGAAYFDVRHDSGRTLAITAGGYLISDIGTRFAVDIADDNFHIAVAEGRVGVTKSGERHSTTVAAGYQLTDAGGDASASLTRVSEANVGSWRQGRLVYENMPIGLVAADIARYSAQNVIVDPALRGRRFSGVLVIGDGSQLLANLAGFMALDLQREKGGVRLGAPGRK